MRKIKEWAGGSINGAPSFQGYAYGYGNKAQMAQPESQVPKDFEEILNQAVSDELESLFGLSETTLTERDASDGFYRDLPGYPPPDTLVSKKTFVPEDPAERENRDMLGPTVGEIPIEDLTINNWKATTPSKSGKMTTVINTLVADELEESMISLAGPGIGGTWNPDNLVAHRDWQKDLETPGDENATANNLSGMGKLVKPFSYVPKSIDNKHENAEKTKYSKVITKKEENMFIKKFTEVIKRLVMEELGSRMAIGEANVENVASEPLLQWQKQVFDNIVAKHGGDYQRAQKSPEWAQALKQAETARQKEAESQKTGLPLPMQAKQPGQTGSSPPGQTSSKPDIRQRLKGTKSSTGTSGNPSDLSHLFPKEWLPGPKQPQQKAFQPWSEEPLGQRQVGENLEIDLNRAPEIESGENDFLDEKKAELLFDFINNDVHMYEAGILPTVNILRKKPDRDWERDMKVWHLVALAGAKKYNRDNEEKILFPPRTKLETARKLAWHYRPFVKSIEKKLF